MEKNNLSLKKKEKNIFFLANWKNGMTRRKVLKFCQNWKKYYWKKKINLGIAPAFIHLELLKKQKLKNVQIWAQDCADKNNDQQTGKIIPLLLKDYCHGVILGHAETGDDNFTIYQKLQLVNQVNLKIILCCGPNLTRKNLTTKKIMAIVKQQLEERIQNLDLIANNLIAIAYEQFDNKLITEMQKRKIIAKMIVFIKKTVFQLWKRNIKVFYGGGIDDKRGKILYQTLPINGFLIGKEALSSKKLSKIIEKINNSKKEKIN